MLSEVKGSLSLSPSRSTPQEQGNPINATYVEDHKPVFLPGELADKPWAVRAILEMARMQ